MWIVQNTSHLTSCDIAARFLKCFVSASDSTKFIRRFDRCFIEIETYPGKQENIDGPSAVLDSCRVEEVAEEIEENMETDTSWQQSTSDNLVNIF